MIVDACMNSLPVPPSQRPSVIIRSPPSRSETPELLRGTPVLRTSPQLLKVPLALVAIVKVVEVGEPTIYVPFRFEPAGAPATVTGAPALRPCAVFVVTIAVPPPA